MTLGLHPHENLPKPMSPCILGLTLLALMAALSIDEIMSFCYIFGQYPLQCMAHYHTRVRGNWYYLCKLLCKLDANL